MKTYIPPLTSPPYIPKPDYSRAGCSPLTVVLLNCVWLKDLKLYSSYDLVVLLFLGVYQACFERLIVFVDSLEVTLP